MCCPSSLTKARQRSFLPSRLDGAGLRSWETTSDFAWFSSMASCIGLTDRDFDFARQSLDWQAEEAYDYALQALGGPSYLEKSKIELLPVGESDVLKRDFYVSWHKDHPKLKLQKLFQGIASDLQRDLLVSPQEEHKDANLNILLNSLKNAEPGTCLTSRLFTAPLSHKESRLNKTSFIIAARQFCCLPPLKTHHGHHITLGCGCQRQCCQNPTCDSKHANLDELGNHGLTCHPGVKALRATLLERAIERAFRKVGGVPTSQPHTYQLCGGIFSKTDLASLFPGNLNATEAARRQKLAMKFLDILRDHPRGAQRTAFIGELRDLEFPAANPNGNPVLRLDLRLPSTDPPDRPKEIWLDHAIVQETAPTYAKDVLEYLELQRSNHPRNSPAIQKLFTAKTKKYENLKSVVQRLSIDKKLLFHPEFLFPVISSLGYYNHDMKSLLNFLSKRCEAHLKLVGPTQDGLSLATRKGKYTRELHTSICFSLIRGNALSLANQGLSGVMYPA